jgi:hypothetical protein
MSTCGLTNGELTGYRPSASPLSHFDCARRRCWVLLAADAPTRGRAVKKVERCAENIAAKFSPRRRVSRQRDAGTGSGRVEGHPARIALILPMLAQLLLPGLANEPVMVNSNVATGAIVDFRNADRSSCPR